MAPSQITVIIPTHNRRETLMLAIESAVVQTRSPAQIVVLADGCTDGTQEAVRDLADPRVELVDLPKGEGRGYGHRNEGLRRARGDVVAWLSDDDLWMPEHLERLGEVFDAGIAEIATATACVVHPDDTMEAIWRDWSVPYQREKFLAGESRTPMSAVAHLVEPARAAGWRADLPTKADMDLWQRMLKAGAGSVCLPAPTVLHFRAWQRDQDEADRTRQTHAFAARLREPRECILVRAAMNAAVQAELSRFEETAAIFAADVEVALAAADAARSEAAETRAALAEAERENERLSAQAATASETLERIYAGGWWRLRDRIHTALRVARRPIERYRRER